jgi:hypothetical protein
MALGFLTPDARLRIVGDLSLIVPGAKLHTYVGGTPATPLATFSDQDLAIGHQNANPVVASAFGLFGPIFLTPGLSYKLVLTDAADVVIWTQDQVAVPFALDGTSLLAPDGTVALQVDSTHFLDSATQPRAIVTNVAQAIPTGVFTALTFATEEANVAAVHSTITNPSRLTVPVGANGLYLVLAYVDWASSAAGNGRIARLMKNGVTEIVRQSMGPTTAFLPVNLLHALQQLVAGDYLTVEVFQDSGGNLNTVATNPSRFSLVKLW